MKTISLIVLLLKCSFLIGEQFETKIIDAVVNTYINESVNASVQFILHYKNVSGSGLRVHTLSDYAQDDNPVIIVVRQEKGVLSWQIPFYVKKDAGNNIYEKYYSVSRTLCPIENNPKLLSATSRSADVFVTVSSSSRDNIKFSIKLTHQNVFYINEINQPIQDQVAPSAPIFFQVNLPPDVDAALVKTTSNDPTCSILSIQNVSCPVYDLDLNVQFEGSYQTFAGQAGITITREQYPSGAYIVLVAKSDDFACHNSLQLVNDDFIDERIKTFELDVVRKITNIEYVVATFGALGMFFGFYMVVLLISCVLCLKEDRMGTIEEDRRPIIGGVATIETGQETEDRLETIPEETVDIHHQIVCQIANVEEERPNQVKRLYC